MVSWSADKTAELLLLELERASSAEALSRVGNRFLWFALIALVLLLPSVSETADASFLRQVLSGIAVVPFILIFTEERASAKLRRIERMANELIPNLDYDARRKSDEFDDYVRKRHQVLSERYSIRDEVFLTVFRREWYLWVCALMTVFLLRVVENGSMFS